ncbi:Xylose isomerase-like TIM barrel [Planctomycetes bacterium Pla163]|uniref:Xylose isomerase-like TIM barrel n=1 Tax=Rohdeia mirabilis TaxID=2528008 RepID=A0A518D2A8_9BACT|nr:Xylose isomerase-like TIM barrel [Planctomycetes bacterium Pla163]
MKSRRQILKLSAHLAALPIATAALGDANHADPTNMTNSQSAPTDDEEHPPPFEISLAQWSLHRTLRSGELTHLRFAPFARSKFDIAAVEYVSTFFERGATDFSYLEDVRRAADDAGVRSLLIMVDGEGRLGAEDAGERRQAVQRHFKWLAAARLLGCHSIRVNAAGSGPRDEHSQRAAESLHHLCEVADEYALSVIVENHGGPSSDGAWLAETIRRADHPRCGTLPDFGNFLVSRTERDDGGFDDVWYDRYRGVEELMPYAKAVSAKSHDFDENGTETRTDFERMLRIVLDAGYHGFVGIEYEGQRLSEVDGIEATQRLLERVRSGLATARPDGR